jgi:bis(5'-adenosyl)-triphosphatase
MAVKFGKWDIHEYEIFWKGVLSYAMVNTKPIVKNHLLVCPFRVVPSFCDLNRDELAELTFAVSRITRSLGPCSVAIQDGREAGQTVPHVHFHIIPRPETGIVEVDSNAKQRTAEEMSEESCHLKSFINFS